MMNKITLAGRVVRCGTTPMIVRSCGFRSPGEVVNAAAKFGKVVAPMRLDDVADWFDEHYGTVDEEAK